MEGSEKRGDMISLTFIITFMSGCPAENSLGKGGAVVSAVIS